MKKFHEAIIADHDMRQVCEQETSTCSKLHHPHIVVVFGIVSHDDGSLAWLVMELLQGCMTDVRRAAQLSEGSLTLREQVDMSRDCLSGLQYLHQLVAKLSH